MRNLILNSLLLTAIFGMSGCFAATTWPQKGLIIDLDLAKATKSQVAEAIASNLASNGFEATGPAGFDAIQKSRTILDFDGPYDIVASVQLDHQGVVLVYFNQNRSRFSPEAEKLLHKLASDLRSKWPYAVSPTESHGQIH